MNYAFGEKDEHDVPAGLESEPLAQEMTAPLVGTDIDEPGGRDLAQSGGHSGEILQAALRTTSFARRSGPG